MLGILSTTPFSSTFCFLLGGLSDLSINHRISLSAYFIRTLSILKILWDILYFYRSSTVKPVLSGHYFFNRKWPLRAGNFTRQVVVQNSNRTWQVLLYHEIIIQLCKQVLDSNTEPVFYLKVFKWPLTAIYLMQRLYSRTKGSVQCNMTSTWWVFHVALVHQDQRFCSV